MRIFRRDQAGGGDQVEAFWAWWASARDRLADAVDRGEAPSLASEITDRVRRLHPRMAWELSPGAAARHALVVTPEGDPELRPMALAWLAAAPPVDETWEYHASRQPGPLGTLGIGETMVDLEGVRVIAGWDEQRELLDVQLWHPAFDGLPEPVRQQVVFLFLDNLLGEDDVERWIGSIGLLEAAIGGRTPDELRDEARCRAANATGQAWVLAERTDGRGERALVSANAALKRIDHPSASTHVCVTVERGIEQLANSAEALELDAAETELVEALEALGAVYAGRVTERRRRRIHLVCPEPVAARTAADGWAARHARFGPRVEVRADPRWSFRGELLG